MKILILSNMYPPYFEGGYELGCQQVSDGLAMRGHDVTVLTSYFGLEAPVVDQHVNRLFNPHVPLLADVQTSSGDSLFAYLKNLKLWQAKQRDVLKAVLARVRPDVVGVWSLRNLASTAILNELQKQGIPTVICSSDFWLQSEHRSDSWLAFWQASSSRPLLNGMKRAIRSAVETQVATFPASLDWRYVYFVSRDLRGRHTEAGLPAADSPVIYWGVNTERFDRHVASLAPPIKLVFAGRLVPDKGVHVVLDALMSIQPEVSQATVFMIAGAGDEAYTRELQAKAKQINESAGLCRVEFLGKVTHTEMPALYRDADVYLFPSIWPEPFALGLLEAMASGLAVVSTSCGGSAEIIKDNENGLVFDPNDIPGLAEKLKQIIEDRSLRLRLAESAYQITHNQYQFEKTVDQVETLLASSLQNHNWKTSV